MYKLVTALFFTIAFFVTNTYTSEDIRSLPYCPNKNGSGLVLVSTLDGNLSAVNSTGSLIWQINTGPGPLLVSNIHKLELTNNGEWIRIIPSLTGTLYKFDGSTIDPIPITAESLLKSSFRYSDDLVIAGGIEVRSYGVGFSSGKLAYECTSVKCSNNNNQDVEDMLLIERTTHTIRAVEPGTGNERWNFSVGLHDVKLPRISCIDPTSKTFDWNLTAVLPEGKLTASTILNNVEHSWQYQFNSPIVRVWRWTGRNLSEVDLFAPKNIPNILISPILPSIYIGMHNKQLYIHESVSMQEVLHSNINTNIVVAESTSIAKIPWKPIPAAIGAADDESTALSVLNLSEYVNGNGYYLYTETDLNKKDTLLCETNNSVIEPTPDNLMEDMASIYYTTFFCWHRFFIMLATLVVGHFLYRIWIHHHQRQEIIVINKTAEPENTPVERRISENESFTSRFESDFDTVSCLGKGGFGLVFEVKQKYDECNYAIKRITLPKEEKSRDRVMREVKALAKLDHKNIVRYFCSWVEHPPLGWQKDHDQKWIGDTPSLLDGITTTGTAPTYRLEKSRRSKSASVSIDIPMRKLDEKFCLDDDKEDDVDDDSFIVFEPCPNEEDKNTTSAHVTFEDTRSKTHTTNTVSSGIEMTNGPSGCEHTRKKIDWKRPGRRHHSWDLTQNNNTVQEAPMYLYIQMQLCKKESLKEWLQTNQERNYKYVLDIFLQILDAVEYVHLNGLIHRDLKPSNIFFSLDGQIKVGDFGLVKDMEDAFDLELMKKGSLSPAYRGHTVEVGTKFYMSPEQLESRIYDYKVDIYSLGLIFFELLFPFSTDMERSKTLTDVKNNKFPKNFSNKYPDEYILLQNMLCQDPNKRLTTIGIKARPPFNKKDPNFGEDCHYRLNGVQKT